MSLEPFVILQCFGTGSLFRIYYQAEFDKVADFLVSEDLVRTIGRDLRQDVNVPLSTIASLKRQVTLRQHFKRYDSERPHVNFLVVAL